MTRRDKIIAALVLMPNVAINIYVVWFAVRSGEPLPALVITQGILGLSCLVLAAYIWLGARGRRQRMAKLRLSSSP